MELNVDEEGSEFYREQYDFAYALNGEEPPQIIQADESYEKTLEMVRDFNPICIVPGTDVSIVWSTRMAHDLGLPGNNPDKLKKMTDKKCMQQSLKEAGLRYIRSEIVNSYEEAKELVCEFDSSKFVVKPTKGVATMGVCVCETDEEIKNAIESNIERTSNNKDVNVIIQEYIGGNEFIINSICCQGHNRISSAFLYHKIHIPGSGPLNDYTETIDQSHPDFSALKEYNDKVINAIGIEYGAVHAEYKVDENGPVLIEINCRVCGAMQKYSVEDETWGEHSTILSLESYLNPEECIKKSNNSIKLLSTYIIKHIILYEDTYIVKSHLDEVFGDLDSVRDIRSFKMDKLYPKTTHLFSSPAYIYLVNKDNNQILKDLEEINRMEKYEFDKLFDIKK